MYSSGGDAGDGRMDGRREGGMEWVLPGRWGVLFVALLSFLDAHNRFTRRLIQVELMVPEQEESLGFVLSSFAPRLMNQSSELELFLW